jgi:uncharacterized protein YndB with AHSA1/START domain
VSAPGTTSITVSRDVGAPPERVFALLADPDRHPDLDATGMVRASRTHLAVTELGDVFTMEMRQEQMGDYVIENHVVEFERDRRIAWEPVLKETDHPEAQTNIGVNAHLRWRWELTPQPDGRTLVTETYDLSRSPEWLHEATREGEDWRHAMEASLANLARMVEEP